MKMKLPAYRAGLLLNVLPNLSPEAPLGATSRSDSRQNDVGLAVGIVDLEEKLVECLQKLTIYQIFCKKIERRL